MDANHSISHHHLSSTTPHFRRSFAALTMKFSVAALALAFASASAFAPTAFVPKIASQSALSMS
jgi:hypothetical protein